MKFFSILFVCCIGNLCHSQNLDINLLYSINSGNSSEWDNVNKMFSKSMTPITITIPSTMFLYGFFSPDSVVKRNSLVMGTSLLTSGIITMGMKYSFNRKRPFVTYPHLIMKKSEVGTPSFPSGHTSQAFAIATSLSLMCPKWYVIAPSFLWAGAVGYSRMELGVHYPSDVLIGALIGAGSSILIWKMNKKF